GATGLSDQLGRASHVRRGAGLAGAWPAGRPGQLDRLSGQPADGTGPCQSALATSFWARPGRHTQRLRRARRAPDASRAARLARDRVRGERLEPQPDAPAAAAVRELSASYPPTSR